MRIIFWTGLLTFVLDQLSKYWVVHHMDLINRYEIDVLPPLLNFRMAWNYGVNFGLMAQDSPMTRWILIGVALIICAAVLWWVNRERGGFWQKVATGLLIGGALGNVVDRVLYGAVADFLNTSCCGLRNPYSFNVADVAVFAGAIGLIFFTPSKKPA